MNIDTNKTHNNVILPDPVGVVLTDEQMGIGYDKRIGNKLWFNSTPTGLLYSEQSVKDLIDLVISTHRT